MLKDQLWRQKKNDKEDFPAINKAPTQAIEINMLKWKYEETFWNA